MDADASADTARADEGNTFFDFSDDAGPRADVGADADRPAPECVTDDQCNDGSWCNGVDFCSRGACRTSPPPTPQDGNPCTDDACAECPNDDPECRPGVDGRVISTPTERCDCVRDEDCQAEQCAAVRCDAGTCVVAPAPDGGECRLDCDGNGVDGVCSAGRCLPPGEGPLQSALCNNGVDDDCDGVTDSGPGCATATQLRLTTDGVPGELLPRAGPTVSVVPWANGQPMPAQDDNLFCTARRVQYRQGFDRPDAVGDPLLTALDTGGLDTDVRTGVTGANGQPGLRVCDGHAALVGPFEILSPEHGLHISALVGLTQAGPPPSDQRLVVSYRTDRTRSTTADSWIAVGIWQSDELRDGPISLEFLVDPPPDATQVWLRVDSWFRTDTSEARDCFWFDELLVSTSRRTPRTGARFRPVWAIGSTRAEAREPFDGRSTNFVLDWVRVSAGSHTMGIWSDHAMVGTHGFAWRFDEVSRAAIAMPSFAAPPATYNRSLPLIAEFGIDLRAAPMAVPASVGLGIAGPQLPQERYAGCAHSVEQDWVTGPLGFAPEARTHAFHRIVLPPAAKALADVDIFWWMDHLDDPNGNVAIDEVDVYFHGDTALDVQTVMALPTPGRTRYDVRVDATVSGDYEVRCHWQVPFRSDQPTLTSEPVTVVLR